LKEELKELIKNAPVKRSGTFSGFFIVPSGEEYDGFFGKNGYNNIILLGLETDSRKWCRITESADALSFIGMHSLNFDIPTEYNSVRCWANKPIKIDNELDLSTITGECR